MNQDLGIFAIVLENNILHEKICTLAQDMSANNKDKQVIFFNQYCEKIDTKNIPILPLSHSKYFIGNLLTFDLQSLLIACNSIRAEHIFYYTDSIPWQSSYNTYSNWTTIFGDPRLKIVTKTEDLYNIYNIVWDKAITYCEEINYDQFSKFL